MYGLAPFHGTIAIHCMALRPTFCSGSDVSIINYSAVNYQTHVNPHNMTQVHAQAQVHAHVFCLYRISYCKTLTLV